MRRRTRQRAASLAATAAVAGVAAAAVLAGSDGGGTGTGRATTDDEAAPAQARRDGERAAPTFTGSASVPPLRPGALRGRLLHSDERCGTVSLDLRTLRRAAGPRLPGCLLDVTDDGRFALLQDGPTGEAARRARVAAAASGTTARTTVPVDGGRTPVLDEDGSLHRCSNGFSTVLRFRRANPTQRPGCLPVRVGRTAYHVPAPDVGPLRLEDGEGRALPLHGPVARAAGPPYAVSVAPGGRFLAVAGRTSGADDAAAVVALHALPLGEQVAAWYLAAGTEVRSLRVSPDGGAVAARVGGRTPDEAARWELLQRGRRGTVGTVGGEALHDVAFAPDGRHVAVATASLVALVLDAATLVPLGRLPLPPTRALAWTAGPPPPLPADGR